MAVFEERLDMWMSVSFLFILIAIGLAVYAIVMITRLGNTVDTRVAEIKSKIGAVIREVNAINRLEYQVNVNQDAKINRLTPSTNEQ